MNGLEDICYKRNPIKEAIIRVDFLGNISQFQEEIPVDISSIIKEYFPIAEPRDVIARELQISNEGLKHIENKTKEWLFFNKERNRHISITKDHFLMVHKHYESYKIFSENFFTIIEPLLSLHPIQLRRFGLRFVNHIEFDKGETFSWSRYLNKNLLCIFNIPSNKKLIARAFHNLELNFGDYNMRFQYGMHNPDYPACIKKKIFILDFDSYYAGILEKDDLKSYFSKFHSSIQEMFEYSITDNYKTILNNGK